MAEESMSPSVRKRKHSESEVVRVSDDEGTENDEKIEENGDDSDECGNPAWADAMQRILRASGPVKKLLTKAKKDADIKLNEETKKGGFEIVENVDGEEKVIKIDEDVDEKEEKPDEKTLRRQKKLEKIKLHEWENLIRLKPSVVDRERERVFARIATKGVVQLFNAVKQQQVTVETKVKKTGNEKKREKRMKNISKGDFLDLLHGRSKSVNVKDEINKSKKQIKDEKPATWEVFRDDFMLGAKMKDWDKPNDDNDNDILDL